MAIVYVWNGATGAADGTSWTDAYTTLGAAWTNWSSGDVIYMHSGHSESSASTINYASSSMTNTDPFICYSVDKDNSDAYTPGTSAQITITGADADLDIDDAAWFHGVYFKVDDGDLVMQTPAIGAVCCVDCTFNVGASESITRYANNFTGLFDSCTFTSQFSTYSMNFNADGSVFKNCTFTGSWGSTLGGFGSSTSPACEFVGCDFSGLTSAGLICSSGTEHTTLYNCAFPSGVAAGANASSPKLPYVAVTAFGCDETGAGNGKLFSAESYSSYGSLVHDTSIYRTAGWTDDDGDTQLSHKITPDASLTKSGVMWFRSLPLIAYADTTGSTTWTVYAVHDFTTAPNKDEAWIEVLYLGTSNSTLYSFAGGRSVFSSATWTVGTEAWTGAAGKTKMELSATATINKTGPYVVRVYLGKYEASKAMWYCPKVEVT